MAYTVILALAGAMIFAATFIPAAIALFLTGKISEKEKHPDARGQGGLSAGTEGLPALPRSHSSGGSGAGDCQRHRRLAHGHGIHPQPG